MKLLFTRYPKSVFRQWAVALTVSLLVTACAPPAASQSSGKFMALSDIHFGTEADSKQYCGWMTETDQALWDGAQTQAGKLVKAHNPNFVIYTGDLPAHCDTPTNRKSEFKTTLDGLADIVSGTSIPVLYMPGNNDTVGGDYCSFSWADYPGGADTTPLDFASKPAEWPVYNGKSNIISQDAVHGYYSVYPLGKPASGEVGLRVIAMNTVIFTGGYNGCMESSAQEDASNAQLNWLAGQLEAASKASPPEKVMIAMHVPAGVDGFTVPELNTRHTDYAYNWTRDLKYTGSQISGASGDWVQKVFLDLVASSNSEIVSILSGHTHLNGIRRVNNCAGDMVELNLSIPAITHDHGSNPAIKIISYGDDYELTEDETFYAERTGKYSYDWSGNKSFKFSTYYGCPTGQDCTTLQKRVAAIGTAEGDYQLLHDMLSVIAVKPYNPPAGQKSYKQALDTKCVPYPSPFDSTN